MVNHQVRLGTITPEVAEGMVGIATQAQERVVDRPLWATRSTMLAAATLTIAAESLGVASAPMEGFEVAKVREAFGVPEDHVVYCLIALGFAASEKPFPGRIGLEEVCYLEHFGQPWTLGDS
jgi:nitroreductase